MRNSSNHQRDPLFIEGNSFDEIKGLASDSVDLIVTSPPYNIGKAYETRVNLLEYLESYRNFANECFRVLKDDGNLIWQVGNFSEDGEVFPLDIYFYGIFKDANFILRNRIVWHFRHGMHAKRRFSGRYETLLWFAKKSDSKFNLDPVRIPNLYPGKRRTKGPRRGELSGNPLGKNPGDFWPDIALDEWEKMYWDIPNVKSHHPEKTKVHPCQFPVELVERCVLALSDEDGCVLDPFMGVGSSAIAALKHGRSFLGIEMSKEYIDVATDRVRSFEEGTLRVRELGRPVQRPSGRMAQFPDEWTSRSSD